MVQRLQDIQLVKILKIGENILKPYNDEISALTASASGKNFYVSSGSLTWIATGTQNPDDTFNAVYLSKIPYTAFAKIRTHITSWTV